jgi:response regulator RpfG family c-di-GMP phosphodiesterase
MMSETNPINVLVVDDRAENLLALEGLLSRPDRNVIKASSGNEALALTLDHDLAMVLMDVQMPDLNGFETAELLRGSERTRHIPIIFITAINKEQQYVFKGYEAGAVDYLFKPVDPDILEAKVGVFCELHRQTNVIQKQIEEIEEKNKTLERQLLEIKTLRGLLSVCAHCNRIRNDEGAWEAFEVYIRDNSEADFSHGICPDCLREFYPEHFAQREKHQPSAPEIQTGDRGV